MEETFPFKKIFLGDKIIASLYGRHCTYVYIDTIISFHGYEDFFLFLFCSFFLKAIVAA